MEGLRGKYKLERNGYLLQKFSFTQFFIVYRAGQTSLEPKVTFNVRPLKYI